MLQSRCELPTAREHRSLSYHLRAPGFRMHVHISSQKQVTSEEFGLFRMMLGFCGLLRRHLAYLLMAYVLLKCVRK